MSEKEVSSGGLVISRQNRILLLKKLRDGNEYWILPKGHIEEGETAEIAALREIREETGLEPPEIAEEASQLRIVSHVGSYTTHTIKHHKVVEKLIHLFEVMFDGDEATLTERNIEDRFDGCGWFDIKEAIELLARELQREIVKTYLHQT